MAISRKILHAVSVWNIGRVAYGRVSHAWQAWPVTFPTCFVALCLGLQRDWV